MLNRSHVWVALFVVLLCSVVWVRSGPRPTQVTGFDVQRALLDLRKVLGKARPRPLGSVAAREARAGLMDRLTQLGMHPTVQRQMVCDAGRCGTVNNIFGEVHGHTDAPLVLLVAHSDSVSSGPGIADDGHGMAIVMEAVRLALQRDPTANALGVLVTDGEEAGLLGAKAFVESHPAMSRVKAVVNVEARGTSGPSYLFETSTPNGWLARIATSEMRGPNASSLFYEVYRRLPNDTDLTVFRDAGVMALKFGFLDGVERYHTPLDDWAYLDHDSVQDQGDHAVAAWLSLGDADFDQATEANDVYGDLLGWTMMRWPEPWARSVSAFALIWVWAMCAVGLRVGRARFVELATNVIAVGAWMLGVLVAAQGLQLLVEAFGGTWTVWRWPLRVGLWTVSVGVLIASAAWWGRTSPTARWGAVWTWMAVGGGCSAVWAPGASYLFVAPTLWACGVFTAGFGSTSKEHARSLWPWLLLSASVGLILWVQLAMSLEVALGLSALSVVGPLAVAWVLLIPSLAVADVRVGIGVVGVGVAVALGCVAAPAATPERPARLSFTHLQYQGIAHWLAAADEAPAGFAAATVRAPVWSGSWSRGAEVRDEPDVRVDVVSRQATKDGQRIGVHISSLRGARGLGLVLPSADTPVWLEGRAVTHGGVVYHVGGAEKIEAEVLLAEASGRVFAFDVLDLDDGVPLRASFEVPVHWGDRSIRVHRVQWAEGE